MRLGDVPLELQLVVDEPGRRTDQLGEVEDRHPEVDVGLAGGLALPGVERQVAERARRHHRVRAGLLGLGQRLDQLAQGDLLAREHDREAAALDLRRVVDRLGAARLDDPLERLRPVGVLEPEQLGRAQDLAAVERRDAHARERLCGDLLQALVALALGDLPQQVAHLDAAGVGRRADVAQIVVHALEQLGVGLELDVGLAQVERAARCRS